MKRLVPLLVSLFLLSPCLAQELTPAAKNAAAAIQPPLPPPIPPQERFSGAATPPTFVAPPMPGQVTSPSVAPTLPAAPSRFSDVKDPRPVAVPSYAPANAKVTSSTSSTGQFIVYGDDLQARSSLSGRCDEISQELSRVLRDKQAWVLPIVIRLVVGEAAKEAGPMVKTTISWITTGGFHIQVNVKVRPELRPKEFRDEVIRALLAERILRGVKEFDSKRTLLPEWVYTGILEALDYRQRARPSAFFAAIFKSGKIYGIEEIIEASPTQMDSLSKTIYQTSCCALVLALLEQPEGGLRFGKFLNALASDTRPERELLNQWFPGFASSSTSLNKWWSLQLASLAAPSIAEPMSTSETVTQLNEALMFRFQAKASEAPQARQVVMAVAKPDPVPRKISAASPPPIVHAASKPEHSRLRAVAKTAASTQNKTTSPEPASEAKPSEAPLSAPGEETKPSGFGKITSLLGFGKKGAAEAEKPQVENTEVEKKPEPKPAPTAPKPKSTPTVEAAPPPAPTPAPVTEEAAPDRKLPPINPLKWFRGGKKDKEEVPAEPPPEGKTSMLPAFDTMLWAWSPLMADLYSATAFEIPAPQQSRQVESILDRLKFGKKKEGLEEPAAETQEPKSLPAEKPPEEKKKSSTSAPVKKEEEKPVMEEPKPTPFSTQDSLSRLRALFAGGKKTEEPVKEAAPAPAVEEKKPEPIPSPVRIPIPAPTPPAPTPEAVEPPTPPAPKPKPVPAPVVHKKPKPVPAPKPAPTLAPAPALVNEPMVSVALPIEDFAEVLKRPDHQEILKRNLTLLASLQERSAVLFRPIILEYGIALTEINQGKTKGLDARLSELRKRTILAAEQGKAVRDLVDVYEANASVGYSGKFDDFLNLPQTIQKELPPRTDPISEYLDALDKEFSKE